MRALLFSDLHAHAFQNYSEMTDGKINSRLVDSIKIIEQIQSIAETHFVDIVLFGGDLFHVRNPISAITFNETYKALKSLRTKVSVVAMLIGNHDQVDKSGSQYSMKAFGEFLTILDRPHWHKFSFNPQDTLYVLALPYRSRKEEITEALASLINFPQQGTKILLGHFGVNGAQMGSNFIAASEHDVGINELQPERFDQIFLGHYHIQQQLLPNMRYLGATHQHNWGDTGQQRGVWIWDTPAGPRAKEVTTSFTDPKFFPLTAAPYFVDLKEEDIQHTHEETINNNFIRIEYKKIPEEKQWEETKAHFISLGARWVDIQIAFEKTNKKKLENENSDFNIGADFEIMIEQYVKSQVLDKSQIMELIEKGKQFLEQAQAKES